MRVRAALALGVAIALPVWGQHQGGHSGGGSTVHAGGFSHSGSAMHGGGSMGHQGSYGRAPNYSGLTGLQQPSSFSAPGLFPTQGRLQPPPRAGVTLPYRGDGFSGGRYGHGPGGGSRDHRGPYRGRDHRRHYRGRGSYGYSPGFIYPYPYVADPGFYDWGATDYSENEQQGYAGGPPDQEPESGYGPEQPGPDYGDAPYPQQQEYAAQPPVTPTPGAQRQEYHFATASPSAPSPLASKPLTVIFKGGRAPEKVQNYMVTSSALTNLDSEHFEKIPLDQIDVGATQQANRSSGIDFQVPVATRD
ncbi:MAG: hypothetical protein JST28_07395 [Acidobacteria bacterium]|nr:hypothetical protein [Acidobacteriota bacterium]